MKKRSGGGVDADDRLAGFHEIELIAGDRLDVGRIGFEKIHFAHLAGEEFLKTCFFRRKFIALSLLNALTLQFRHEQHDDQNEKRKNEEEFDHAVEGVPDCGVFAVINWDVR